MKLKKITHNLEYLQKIKKSSKVTHTFTYESYTLDTMLSLRSLLFWSSIYYDLNYPQKVCIITCIIERRWSMISDPIASWWRTQRKQYYKSTERKDIGTSLRIKLEKKKCLVELHHPIPINGTWRARNQNSQFAKNLFLRKTWETFFKWLQVIQLTIRGGNFWRIITCEVLG